MQLELGAIVQGKVTGITKFGAFVELQSGKSGMVHISEVASTFIDDISNILSVGDVVKVKIINIADDGKIALSIKKAEPPAERPAYSAPKPAAPKPKPNFKAGGDQVIIEPSGNKSFEDMMSKFKSRSEEKMSDLKRKNPDSRKYRKK